MMYRRELLSASMAGVLMLLPAGALAQQQQPISPQQQSIKSALPGVWDLLLIDGIDAEGINHPLFGPNPEGSAIYTANGHMAVEIMRTINRPRFASGNREKGTTDENAATVQGTLAYFGTYTVDEAANSLTEHVEGSTFPNLEGAKRPIKVVQITNEVMTLELPIAITTIPGQGGYKTIKVIWKKSK
jgi:hypothetical protein